jgi:hypothetical protein
MDISIVKSSRGKPMIMRSVNGRFEAALNWRDLAEEASVAIEPEVRERWSVYWQGMITRGNTLLRCQDSDSMMHIEKLPSSYYSCPPELAARVIWPSGTTITPLFIESVK